MRFLRVNPNNAERYPRDSFEAMQERVAADGGWPHPYLHDESQEVGALPTGPGPRPTCSCSTPRGRLRYRGAPDADHRDASEDAAWLRDALDAVLAGEEPARPETEPVGCSVKWR